MVKVVSEAEKPNELCPICHAPLVIRSGRHGPFLRCSGYPDCQYLRPLKGPADGHVIKVLDEQYCPKCHSALVLRQGRYGMFISCSDYPQCDHTELIDKPENTAIACPQCHSGHLLQRKSRYGKTFYACDGYPECQFTINNKPVAGTCAFCGYALMMEKRTSQGTRQFCASKLCGKQVVQQDAGQDE
jgi:putative DNA topoisomerase